MFCSNCGKLFCLKKIKVALFAIMCSLICDLNVIMDLMIKFVMNLKGSLVLWNDH